MGLKPISQARMGSRPSTASSVAPDITVCPPWAKSRSSAARFIVGAGVDALVDQLRLTGVNPDAQDDRGQRSLVQLQSTCDGIAGMGERGDEAIAHALIN